MSQETLDRVQKMGPDTFDEEVHHHRSREQGFPEPGKEFTALCGTVKPSHPNPLILPCCPLCNMVLEAKGGKCQGEMWQTP